MEVFQVSFELLKTDANYFSLLKLGPEILKIVNKNENFCKLQVHDLH